MLISRPAAFVLPASSKFLVDEVVIGRRHDLLLPLALAAGAATLVDAVASYALAQIVGAGAHQSIAELRRAVHAHVTRLPVRYFDTTQTGILISRIMSDAEGVRNLIGMGLVRLAGSIVSAVLGVGVLVYLNWRLTAITLAVLAVFAGGMTVAFRRLRPLFRERGQIYAELTGRLSQGLGGIREVKAYTAERRERMAFTHGAHRLLRNQVHALKGISATNTLSTVVLGAVGVLMILVGGRDIVAGYWTIGDFLMYAMFVALVASPIVQVAGIGAHISEALAGLDRLREVWDTMPEDDGDADRVPLDDVRGEVRFEDVSFEYTTGAPVLRGISFVAPAGSTTALIGSSGSGKSTLTSLAMAFNRPTSGRVLVDGHDLREVQLASYRRHLGVVLQDTYLFDGTIADNIRYSKPRATMEEVQEAARTANCDGFIQSFADTYATVVGERGVRLSGGQRQRVAIARAILANPRILILDEATSSLDTEAEKAIQDALRSLRRGRTTFVIAHRLSTVRTADQILVIEGGRIVECGTHAALYRRGGRYRELYDRQHARESDLFDDRDEAFPSLADEPDAAPRPARASSPRGPRRVAG